MRSFDPNPILNNIKSQNKLKFFNMLITTMEIHLPIDINLSFISNPGLMFFVDIGVGSNSYKKIDLSNKLKGYGVGLKFNTNS